MFPLQFLLSNSWNSSEFSIYHVRSGWMLIFFIWRKTERPHSGSDPVKDNTELDWFNRDWEYFYDWYYRIIMLRFSEGRVRKVITWRCVPTPMRTLSVTCLYYKGGGSYAIQSHTFIEISPHLNLAWCMAKLKWGEKLAKIVLRQSRSLILPELWSWENTQPL